MRKCAGVSACNTHTVFAYSIILRKGFMALSANGYAIKSKATEQANVQSGDLVHVLRPVGINAPLRGIPGGVDKYNKPVL